MNNLNKLIDKMVINDLSSLGSRMRQKAIELLRLWDEVGVPDDFRFENVQIYFK